MPEKEKAGKASELDKEVAEAIEGMSEKEFDYFIAFSEFTKWLENKEGAAETNKEAVEMFTKKFHYPPNSPITMLYTAFCAGMNSGIELGLKYSEG